MPKPIKRTELIRRLRQLGWAEGRSGGNHTTMRRGERKIPIPNPHRGDLDWSLTKRIIAQAGISPEEWEKL
jgi:predicted RNA binding protein YcfA (HicA-like mRNA interferase family)